MNSSKRVGHYVSSTHWDREWYESFQDFRFRLVNMLDGLLETMTRDPAFRYFQTDGQAIMIEDYLEIRPERRDEVLAFAEQGRLRIGPWYVLPDEFLVSGESIVRNLQMGIKIAAKYGKPSRVGFVNDEFGHISQLPQIFRGFGIDNAFVWRGCNDPTHGAMFRWQAADGSEVLAYRFSGFGGYCTYTFHVRQARDNNARFEMEEALQGLRKNVEHEMKRCPTSSFLLFDGGDHLEIESATSALLARGNEAIEGVELIHSHLEGFVEDLREQRDKITTIVKGELRNPGMLGEETWLIPGVLSSRIGLKQANARCENELCLWSEPFSTFAASLGRPYPHRYLELAWRHLLENHPHDSMCGCSIDQVHKDMVYRFDQSRLIATRQTRDALEYIADRVTLPAMGENDFAVVVFNPGSEAIDEPIDLTLRFPVGLDATYQEFFGFEPKIGFRLFDGAGKELPYQYVGHARDRVGFRRRLGKYPEGDIRHEVQVAVQVQAPAYGYTTILCKPEKAPTRHLGSMAVNDHTIANEHLEVSVASNGTLTVTDKRSGNRYERLLTLEDCADIGDGWYHGVAVQDQVFSSVTAQAQTAMTADGIAKATLTIRVTLQVPKDFIFPQFKRSGEWTPLQVTHHVTLRQGSEAVEVRTEVENTIRDHRLRVLFPSGSDTATYLSDQAYDVVERPIALRADNARYKELEVETRPQQTWTAVYDKKRGLAVVSCGLPECTVRDLPERPIALTLLRSFVKAVFTSGNEGGQIQDKHEFHYWIVPLTGAPDVAGLCRLGQKLAGGVRAVQVEHWHLREQLASGSPARELPASQSFLPLQTADAVVTAIHRTDDGRGQLIRMFNPRTESVQAVMGVPAQMKTVHLTDLEGRPQDPVSVAKGQATLTLQAKQIQTIRLGPVGEKR